ncbi:hypothetical protein Mapa_001887 [Marchantia paleacea]|nr:hypothetical protein Mapa_001887 [Marchantia paleacea]
MKGIRSTTELIMQLLAEYLGLESNFFSKYCFPNGTTVTRWNYYPLCPVPDITLGAREHTDPNFITLLYQDSVGGLQVKKDGEWYGVRPIRGALVINIADSLHIISNGYFKTVIHQVVVNQHAHRLSLVCAVYLENEADLSAPEELLSEKSPRLYKKMYSWEYWNMIFAGREKLSTADGSVLNGLNILKNVRIL